MTLGDIALHPERATTINDGVLTYSQAEVDELSRSNYAQARRALTAQAQGFRWLAEQRARAVVGEQVRRALPGTEVRVEVR